MVEPMIPWTDILTCPLCGATTSSLFDRRSFRGKVIINRKCDCCGLVFQSPRMTQHQLDQFYLSEYRLLYQGDAAPIKKDLAIQTLRAKNLSEFLQAQGINHLERHLDIGSSAGLLMDQFQRSFGCHSVGIEPGEAYRQEAGKNGLQVYASEETMMQAGEGRFDLISLIHVLEHFPDPVKSLVALRQNCLKPQGWLMVEVPNLYCHDSFEIAHLVSYSPHTLIEVLKKAGFQIVALRTHGRPRSALLPLYITVLAKPAVDPDQPAGQVTAPEAMVGMKRQVGLYRRKIIERLNPQRAWLPIAEN